MYVKNPVVRPSVRIVLNDVSQHLAADILCNINIINAAALIRHGPSERCARQRRIKTNQSALLQRLYAAITLYSCFRIIILNSYLLLSSLCVCVCDFLFFYLLQFLLTTIQSIWVYCLWPRLLLCNNYTYLLKNVNNDYFINLFLILTSTCIVKYYNSTIIG